MPGNRGNSGGKGAPGNRGNSSKGRGAAECIRDVRGYVAEHGRPPRSSSSLVGTAEYKLRQNMQKQVKKGFFSEEERKQLTQLLGTKERSAA